MLDESTIASMDEFSQRLLEEMTPEQRRITLLHEQALLSQWSAENQSARTVIKYMLLATVIGGILLVAWMIAYLPR